MSGGGGRGWLLGALFGAMAVVGVVAVGTFAMAVVALGKIDTPVARAEGLLSFAQAATTLLLVLLTAFYVRSTHAMAEEMKAQREWTEARARQAQARLVAPRVTAIEAGQGDDAYAVATIRNASAEPVYGAAIRLLDWVWRSERRVIDYAEFGVISPGEETEPMEFGPLGPIPKGAESTVPPIEIEFSDSYEHRWRRQPDGRLVARNGPDR